MPTSAPPPSRSVADFAKLFTLLAEEGIDYTVVGGCAVGAYAALQGDPSFSSDLDLLLSEADRSQLLHSLSRFNANLTKAMQPRGLSVAVITWEKQPIDLFTELQGFPSAHEASQTAREFILDELGVAVPIADPYLLLKNKLLVNREKDQSHIQILKRYLKEEVVADFCHGKSARERHTPLRRWLRTCEQKLIDDEIGNRIVECWQTEADLRFLAVNLASDTLFERALGRLHEVAAKEELRALRKQASD